MEESAWHFDFTSPTRAEGSELDGTGDEQTAIATTDAAAATATTE